MRSSRGAALAVGGNVFALALLAVSWTATANRVNVAAQLPWLALGAAAVAVAGVTDAAVVIGLRRRLSARAAALVAWAGRAAPVEPTTAASSRAASPARLVAVRRGRFAHDASCQLVRGKATSRAPADAAMCPVCRP